MESQEMKDWKYSSWKFHQDMYQMLYDRMWDEVNKDDLNEKLIYAFTICFGEGYYEKEELRKITDKVKLKLLELFENSMYIRIGFTFISYKLVNDAKTEGIQCLIWTQRTDGRELCIDLNSRTYKDWDDFIKNNVLPKCYIIYPKCGRYASHTETNIYVEKFIDLRFEKSVACSKTRKVKIALDITAGIGCAVATTALMANPVSAPILAGIILTGSYNVGSNVVKLKDISNHDGGISIKDPKSLIVIGDIVLTVAGTAAMGVGTISKQVVAGRGIFSDLLSSSSAVIKIADNVGNINKCISTVNLLFNIAVVVSKCFSNTLQHSDILYFGRILLFGFNIKLSKILLEELIRNIANYFTDVDVIGTLSSFACRGYEMVKQIRNFSKQYHIKEVIYYIFGTFSFGKPVLQISSLINDITKNVTDAIEEFKSQFKNCKKIKIECLIKVCDKLFISLSAIRKYNSQCKENIEITYGERTWKYVQTLVKYDGIDCCLDNSEYDNKINVPNEIDRIVKETLKMCSKYHSSCTYTSNQDKLLFSLIVESLSEHHLKNSKYIINMASYYCKCFFHIYSSAIKLHHYEYFLYDNEEGNNRKLQSDKTFFFNSVMKVPGNPDIYFFKESLNTFKKNLGLYYEEFNSNYTHDLGCNEHNSKKVWYFEIPNKETLSKREYYLKAKELIPFLGNLIDEQSTIFTAYFGRMAVIKSKLKDSFTLYFYIKNENNNIVGILIQA